jgi:hypothetical protein
MATDVQNEVTRIANAKAACVTSLTNKGVTVPPGVKLGGIPALINSIPEPVYETWVFTMEDGSTVEKEVEVSG